MQFGSVLRWSSASIDLAIIACIIEYAIWPQNSIRIRIYKYMNSNRNSCIRCVQSSNIRMSYKQTAVRNDKNLFYMLLKHLQESPVVTHLRNEAFVFYQSKICLKCQNQIYNPANTSDGQIVNVNKASMKNSDRLLYHRLSAM